MRRWGAAEFGGEFRLVDDGTRERRIDPLGLRPVREWLAAWVPIWCPSWFRGAA